MYMICSLTKRKRDGLYIIGAAHGTHADPRDAITHARQLRRRWRGVIPVGEISVPSTVAVLRAWETQPGCGLAVITDTPDRVPSIINAPPSLA
jgi:hypothetical protein